MKKIACVLGSPRKDANGETLARKVMETAEALGAKSEVFRLYKLDFKGCLACMACKQHAEECVVRDGLTDVLRAIAEADILILTSPVYFGQIAGELKCCIDRMYSFLPPTYLTGGSRTRLAPGKQCVFVLTQGAPDAGAFADVYPNYERFLGPEWMGYETHLLRGVGLRAPDEAAANAELMQQADALGRALMAE